MSSVILYLHPLEFAIAAERKRNPLLKGKAVIISDPAGGRVLFCSSACTDFGLRPGMPLMEARRLAPHAIIVSADEPYYQREAAGLTRVIADAVPVMEKVASGEIEKGTALGFYACLSMPGGFLEALRWARQFKQQLLREHGFPFAISLARNKFVAFMAAKHAFLYPGSDMPVLQYSVQDPQSQRPDSKSGLFDFPSVFPGTECSVPPGEEKRFLSCFPVEELAFTNPEHPAALRRNGVATLGQLAALSPGRLQRLLGKEGMPYWQKANGIYHQPLIPYKDADSISSEVLFSKRRPGRSGLRAILNSMTDKLNYSLKKRGMVASTLAVKIRYADFTTVVKETSIAPVMVGKKLNSRAEELFRLLYDSGQDISLLGMRLGGLEKQDRQMQLFTGPAELSLNSFKRVL